MTVALTGQNSTDQLVVTLNSLQVYQQSGPLSASTIVNFSFGGRAAGSYTMVTALETSGGTVRASASESITIYQTGSVVIDQWNNLLVNSAPHFPLTLWEDDTHIFTSLYGAGSLSGWGWVDEYWPTQHNATEYATQMTSGNGFGDPALIPNSPHGVIGPGRGGCVGSPCTSDIGIITGIGGTTTYHSGLIPTYTTNSTITNGTLMWYWVDEPDSNLAPYSSSTCTVGSGTGCDQMISILGETHSNDSNYRPMIVDFYAYYPSTIGRGFAVPNVTTDVVSYDNYPYIWSHRFPGTLCSGYIDSTDISHCSSTIFQWIHILDYYRTTAFYDSVPVMPILEGGGEADGTSSACVAGHSCPSLNGSQWAMEAYLSIIHGARGYGLWTSWAGDNSASQTTSVSATESGSTVTLTAGSNWNTTYYQNGLNVNVTSCSVGGYNGVWGPITVSGTTLTLTGPALGLSSATGCTVVTTSAPLNSVGTAETAFLSNITSFMGKVISKPPTRTVTSNQTTNCNPVGPVAGSRVDAMTRDQGGYTWVIAQRVTDDICDAAEASASTLSTQLTISGLANATATVIGESRAVPVLNGIITDNFDPYAHHIYQIPYTGVPAASGGVRFQGGVRHQGGAGLGGGTGLAPLSPLGYTGTDVTQWPLTIPNVGGATKITTAVYDTSLASPAPVYRCTDSLTIPNPGTNSSVTGGLGGSGSAILSNLNATLWHINTGNGADAIIMFNPSTGQCGDPNTGRAITTDKNSAGGGDAVHFADFGAGNFSLSQNMLWYSFGGGTGSNATTILPVTFATAAAPTNIQYTWGSQIADFANGLPNASNTPEWAVTTAYSNGAYVKHTLTASEYWTWVTGTAVQLGDIMLLSGCAYKVTTAGTTGGTIPTGHTTCNTNSLPTDGTVKWKDLGGPAAFIYQLTSSSGTSGGSTPTFTTTCGGCVSHHADFMATVTDSTLTWTNVGVAQNPGGIGWISWGGTSADDTKFAEVVNTNSYGYSGSYTRCQGGQDCGLWAMEYDSTANKYYLFNTYTGIQSSVTCSGAGGTTCGSWVTQGTITTNIASLPSNGFCQFGLHNEKMNRDGNYAVVVQQGAAFGGTCTALNFYVWRPLQTFSATNQMLVFAHGLNHWTPGLNYVAALNDAGYTSPSGVFMTYTPLNNPAADGAYPACTAGAGNCPLIFWEGHPCNDTPSNEPACTLSISIDAHPSMAYNPGGTDNSPVCTTAYNYGSLSPIETYPYQGEELCIKSATTWMDSSAPATNPAYRLVHSFNDGTNDQFNTQFGISEYSQDGHWLIFTTDWDSTLGTVDGSDPTCSATYPCTGGFQVAPTGGHNCLGGMPWQANHNYPLGTVLHPIQGTGGGGTIYEVVQNVACSGSCTSGSSHPAWNTTDPVGTTYTDNAGANQITWKVLATKGNCRGDLFAVKTAN